MDEINNTNFWAKLGEISYEKNVSFQELLPTFLKENLHLINQYDEDGCSLLATPIRLAQVENVKILIEYGASVYQPVFNPQQHPQHQHVNAIEWARIRYQLTKNSQEWFWQKINPQLEEIFNYLKPFENIKKEIEQLESSIDSQSQIKKQNKI
jgi:hypothetical protein